MEGQFETRVQYRVFRLRKIVCSRWAGVGWIVLQDFNCLESAKQAAHTYWKCDKILWKSSEDKQTHSAYLEWQTEHMSCVGDITEIWTTEISPNVVSSNPAS